mmetsp:Transcript_5371/g.14407  ORF Transcript_5371/g.14407 Transcript_5371/m.14407 type:complete len:84 (+) Transcript_5371:989-1240(+)
MSFHEIRMSMFCIAFHVKSKSPEGNFRLRSMSSVMVSITTSGSKKAMEAFPHVRKIGRIQQHARIDETGHFHVQSRHELRHPR